MKIIKISVVGIVVLLLSYFLFEHFTFQQRSTTETAETIPVPSNPYIRLFADSLDNYLYSTFEKTEIPGMAVTVVHQGKTVLKAGYGVKVKGSIYPIDTTTIFRLASVSKGFSSILAGTFVSDSLLSWDDPVSDYLPWIALKEKRNTDSLKVIHLLSHTTGLQYQAYTTLVEEEWIRNDILRKLADADIISDVGRLYSYQNAAYSIIEPVLENISNKEYHEIMQDRLFDPLNMNYASIEYEKLISSANVAQPHLYRGYGRFRRIEISPKYYNVAAAGGVNASISDMEKWLKALTGYYPDVVSPDVLDAVFEPYIRTALLERSLRRINRRARSHYGMGWRIVHFPSDTIVYHGGYANGYRSAVALSRKDEVAIAILTNSSLDVPGEIIADFFNIYKVHADSIKNWKYENVF